MSGSIPPTAAAIGGGGSMSTGRKVLLFSAAIGVFIGISWIMSGPSKKPEAKKPVAFDAPGQVGSSFDAIRQPREAALPVPTPPTFMPNLNLGAAPVYHPTPLMMFGDATGDAGIRLPGMLPSRTAAAEAVTAGKDGLVSRLSAEDQPTAVATQLPDRNLFLTEGTPIPCVPDAPITSDVEGAFRCKVPEAVYSTSGAVPLLDEGTWIAGRVNSGLRRGQRRLFAVMTRIETPQGCLVRIRAPAADALGQAGLDGDIDTHFFERFSAYLGMAFIDAAMQGAVLAASNAASSHSGNNNLQFYQFQQAGQQGGQALFADQANIPSTLYRPQAWPLVVRLTQDVDMRTCFKLSPRN